MATVMEYGLQKQRASEIYIVLILCVQEYNHQRQEMKSRSFETEKRLNIRLHAELLLHLGVNVQRLSEVRR